MQIRSYPVFAFYFFSCSISRENSGSVKNHRSKACIYPALIREIFSRHGPLSSGVIMCMYGNFFNNLVPFPALFLIYFFLLLQYSILQDSSSLHLLRWGGSSCAEQIICAGLPAEVLSREGGCRAGESNPGLPYSSPARYLSSLARYHSSPARYHGSPARYLSSPARYHSSMDSPPSKPLSTRPI